MASTPNLYHFTFNLDLRVMVVSDATHPHCGVFSSDIKSLTNSPGSDVAISVFFKRCIRSKLDSTLIFLLHIAGVSIVCRTWKKIVDCVLYEENDVVKQCVYSCLKANKGN